MCDSQEGDKCFNLGTAKVSAKMDISCDTLYC